MRSSYRLPLAALTIAAAILRFATIDVQSYWFDEALTAHLLKLPLSDMIAELPDRELTPPLYYLVAWPWAHLFGTSELALRSLSAVFGIATVPIAYAAARQLASARAGLAVAALTAFSPLLVWYSQEARPYSLLVLLAGLSILAWARALEDRRERTLALWALAALAALLTHYYAAFLVVPQGLWLLWVWRPRVQAASALGAIGAVGVALIPLAVHQSDRIGTGYISGMGLARRALGVPEDFLTGFVIGFDRPVELVLAAVAGVVAVTAFAWAVSPPHGHERRGALLAAALSTVALGVPFLFAVVGIDYLNTRNMLVAWVPAAIVVGIGLAASRRAGVIGIAALCLVGVVATIVVARDSTYQREDWRSASHALGPPVVPRLVAVPPVSGPVGLTLYRDGLEALPPSGATVLEIAYVAPYNVRLHAARPRPAAPPGFPLVQRLYRSDLTLFRYRAARPEHVDPATAARMLAGATVLIERPGLRAPSPNGL